MSTIDQFMTWTPSGVPFWSSAALAAKGLTNKLILSKSALLENNGSWRACLTEAMMHYFQVMHPCEGFICFKTHP